MREELLYTEREKIGSGSVSIQKSFFLPYSMGNERFFKIKFNIILVPDPFKPKSRIRIVFAWIRIKVRSESMQFF